VLIDHRQIVRATPVVPLPVSSPRRDVCRRLGEWLRDHQRTIRKIQWGVVAVYALLLVVPVLRPLPDRFAHIWSDVTLFAQFVFWGLWWPFVLLSMMLVGRAWCGLFCPEGSLTEFASLHGRGRAIPSWITWGGWPFTAFAATTVYGQMVSVYQYPAPALLILGGSTLAAIAVGASFGSGKRVWCRFLCPVSGVFGVLAKLAPLHFEVDGQAWQASQNLPKQLLPRVNCAPLVPIRTMRGASQCHMCGRCSGFRGAVMLASRSPNHEIVEVAGDTANVWETAIIIVGMIGIASGAFQWSVSPWFIGLKQSLAAWLIGRGTLWPLETTAPWWILTNYPANNDSLTLLDGALLIVYILMTAAVVSLAIALALASATRVLDGWSWQRFHHLAQSLIPVAGCGVFLGLSSLSVTLLRAEGLSLHWVGAVRMALIAGASIWTLALALAICGRYTHSKTRAFLSVVAIAFAVAAANASPVLLFWVW
jgi:polyferredoxin